MSQVTRGLKALAVGCSLLAVLAVGCSKKSGTPFDPDAGHPDDFFAKHAAEYRDARAQCAECHGTDLLGGIAIVSCYSTARDGQSCHPGGPGGHPAGWRALHSADPSQAAACAVCHDNKSNNLAPNCFDNSLCHGPKSGHPSGWRSVHSKTNPSLASSCAACHDNKSNNLAPNCFDNSLCHGAKSSHPAGWLQSHTRTDQGQASVCATCHQSRPGTPGCFNNTLCHATKSSHPAGWRSTHTGTNQNQASVCAGCHQSSPGTPGCFNNTLCHGVKSAQHPAGWRSAHQSTSAANASGCAGCHPEKGVPTCMTATPCHGGGGGHPAGWAARDQHGAAAKAAPGGSSGFGYCESCHGSALGGGSGQACTNAACHGWSAPHASSGWSGGGARHETTNRFNYAVCAQCHPITAPDAQRCGHNGSCH